MWEMRYTGKGFSGLTKARFWLLKELIEAKGFLWTVVGLRRL
jgi:hypothetical protein